MTVISNTQSLRAGIQADLISFWKQKYPIYKEQQALLIHSLKTTNIRNVSYAFKESLPFVKLWAQGMPRKYQSFQDRIITMNKVPYEMTLSWDEYDERDDQLGDMKPHIQSAVDRFGMLPDVLIAEYINGSASYNPSLSLCYDGAPLYSATDGDGNARLGATGGNIVTGSGLNTAAIIHDLAVVQQRLLSFVDPTAGMPIFSPEDVDYKNMVCIIPKTLNEIFQKASESTFIKLDQGTNTAEGNYMAGKFAYKTNQYLTDVSNWHVALKHNFWKAFCQRPPDKIENIIADASNSDRARETKENAIFMDMRTKIGPLFPGVLIEVSN